MRRRHTQTLLRVSYLQLRLRYYHGVWWFTLLHSSSLWTVLIRQYKDILNKIIPSVGLLMSLVCLLVGPCCHCVHSLTHRGETERGQSLEYILKSSKNKIFNEHPVPPLLFFSFLGGQHSVWEREGALPEKLFHPDGQHVNWSLRYPLCSFDSKDTQNNRCGQTTTGCSRNILSQETAFNPWCKIQKISKKLSF